MEIEQRLFEWDNFKSIAIGNQDVGWLVINLRPRRYIDCHEGGLVFKNYCRIIEGRIKRYGASAICSRPGYLYFITSGNVVKIGKSESPRQRLRDISVYNPNKLELIFQKEFYNIDLVERLTQYKFHQFHIKGEWFYYSQEIKDFIAHLQNNPENSAQSLMLSTP